ncbi:glycosyltransferase family 2 protein [Thermopirellula anaerolimosa]
MDLVKFKPRVGKPDLLNHSGEDPLLSVIVPVYNEARTIEEVLRRVLEVPYDKQVIVVDDGSTDRTPVALEKWKGHAQVVLLRHSDNRGKGAAIRTGLEHARARFVLIQDADLEYHPSDYGRLLQPLLAGQADVVYGSRRLGQKVFGRSEHSDRNRRGLFWVDRWFGRLRELANPFYHGVTVLNLLVRLLYRVRITDEATCYKVFPTEVLRAMELECERFEFCPEVTAKAARMGLRIVEVPIHYQGRSVREGKKIRFRDGLAAMATLWKYRRWQLRPARSVGELAHGMAATCTVGSRRQ